MNYLCIPFISFIFKFETWSTKFQIPEGITSKSEKIVHTNDRFPSMQRSDVTGIGLLVQIVRSFRINNSTNEAFFCMQCAHYSFKIIPLHVFVQININTPKITRINWSHARKKLVKQVVKEKLIFDSQKSLSLSLLFRIFLQYPIYQLILHATKKPSKY